jgi:hypothetical protein
VFPAAESDTGLTDSATMLLTLDRLGMHLTLPAVAVAASDSAEPGKHIECTIEHAFVFNPA